MADTTPRIPYIHAGPGLTMPQGPIKTTGYSRHFFACPVCRLHEFSILPEHHLNGTFHWNCDVCGVALNIQVGAAVEDITLEVNTRPRSQTLRGWALLKYVGGGLPQHVIVESSRYGLDPEEESNAHMRYYFDEHTCPTNFMRVEHVVFNGDADPHGIYHFVRWVSKKEICEKFGRTFAQMEDAQMHGNGRDYWAEIFPEILTTSAIEEPSTYEG